MSLSVTMTQLKPADGNDLLARSSHAVTVVGETMYVFGGENVARNVIDDKLHAFDLKPDSSWREVETKGTPPCARFAQAQAAVGNSFYLFGGRQGIAMEELALNDLHRFDVDTLTWSQVEYTGTAPSERSFHRMVSIGDMLFVFGGCDNKHGRVNDLFAFDIKTSVWTQMPSSDAIKGRGGPNLIASPDGKRVFVTGGFSGEENMDMHSFDLETQTWTQVETAGWRARSVCISSSLSLSGGGGVLVVFGGEVNISEKGHEGAGEFENDVVLFDGEGKFITVAKPENAPVIRGWGSGDRFGPNSLIFFGGLTGTDADPTRLNDIWKLDVTEIAAETCAE